MLNNFSINKKKLKAKAIIKIVSIFCIVFAFIFGFYFWFKNSNLSTILTDMQKLKEWILSFGFWSYFVFVILQFLQVTFLPLPSSLTTLTGVVIFGPFYTFLLSTLSIMLGSIFAYLLGKTFGIKFLNLIFGKQRSASFQNKLKNSNIIFFFMMLFPMFPDDLLCMLAGVMNMNFKFFLITNLITRPVGLFCLCFIGAGYIIPFHSWGIWVWALIAIVFLCLIVVFFNKKSKIRRIFNDKVFVFNKKTNNKLG